MVEGSNRYPASRGVDIAVTSPTFIRANAAKKLAKRMLQGYQATSFTCPDCGVPLMTHRGIVRCVVCMEQLISKNLDSPYSGSETELGTALQESRNEECDRGLGQNAENVIRVTEDGIEIAPWPSPDPSASHIKTWAPIDIEDCDEGQERNENETRNQSNATTLSF